MKDLLEELNQYDEIRLAEKGKQGILKILFGRTGIILALLLIQIGFMFGIVQFLGNFLTYIYGGIAIFAGVFLIYLINTDYEMSVKLTWVILTAVVPVFAVMLYIYVHRDLGHRALKHRVAQLVKDSGELFPKQRELMEELKEKNPGLYHIAVYTRRAGGFPVYTNSAVKYFPLGEDKFEELLIQLKAAEHFIFLEYFIIEEGDMWGKILKILVEKVEQGVEVRLMYDGTCEFAKLPHNYPKKLEALGIKCKIFSPITPFMSTHYNYRDHRKILVIDGHTAFTGGVNLADEYINQKVVYGHWKDTAVMIRGEAVNSFTLMFLQMWNITERYALYEPYLMEPSRISVKEKGYVLPYGDVPLDHDRVGEMIYMDMLNRAERYVHIMTPYLILDGEMTTALQYAARRGIDVRIILPHIPDKTYAFALAKSHYRELLRDGVKIYEYTPGFVHAKVFVSDDKKAVVGTINLDYRSLYHHFECAAYMEDVPAVADIEKDFQGTMEKCEAVTPESIRQEKWWMKLMGRVLKLVAPLM